MRNFATIFDQQTIEQAEAVERIPIVYPEIALMPDTHFGYGVPIGAVVPTRSGVIPAAVGVDIACGMTAIKLQDRVTLLPLQRKAVDGHEEEILAEWERMIPVSAGQYRSASTISGYIPPRNQFADEIAPNWRQQVGTLGGGNHFLELSYDENDELWLVVHSGSRGVGNKIGKHFIALAKEVHPEGGDNAWLDKGTPEYDQYVEQVRWCEDFAAASRFCMLEDAGKAVWIALGAAMSTYGGPNTYTTAPYKKN